MIVFFFLPSFLSSSMFDFTFRDVGYIRVLSRVVMCWRWDGNIPSPSLLLSFPGLQPLSFYKSLRRLKDAKEKASCLLPTYGAGPSSAVH